MSYGDAKVYFDGSHYIAIPHTEQPWKKRKVKTIETNQVLNEESLDATKSIVSSEVMATAKVD